MINRPETRDLLAEARQVLLDSLVPELGGERKYEALMIANAMGMASANRNSKRRESLNQPTSCSPVFWPVTRCRKSRSRVNRPWPGRFVNALSTAATVSCGRSFAQ